MPWIDWCADEKYRVEKSMNMVSTCTVCGESDFSHQDVLWDELVNDWQLSPLEVDYINRQQGFSCVECGNNLRSMALANAVLTAYGFSGTLVQFVESDLAKKLNVLEINEAGGLSSTLKGLPNHQLISYPEYDMASLSFESGVFDLVIHSDTLEHVPNPIIGLSECRRVLKKTGSCIFTIPVVLGRLSKSREGLKNSYHGSLAEDGGDFLVQTEFGCDAWKYALEAGFTSVAIYCVDYPAGLAFEARI